jgi:hypothetical protein
MTRRLSFHRYNSALRQTEGAAFASPSGKQPPQTKQPPADTPPAAPPRRLSGNDIKRAAEERWLAAQIRRQARNKPP